MMTEMIWNGVVFLYPIDHYPPAFLWKVKKTRQEQEQTELKIYSPFNPIIKTVQYELLVRDSYSSSSSSSHHQYTLIKVIDSSSSSSSYDTMIKPFIDIHGKKYEDHVLMDFIMKNRAIKWDHSSSSLRVCAFNRYFPEPCHDEDRAVISVLQVMSYALSACKTNSISFNDLIGFNKEFNVNGEQYRVAVKRGVIQVLDGKVILLHGIKGKARVVQEHEPDQDQDQESRPVWFNGTIEEKGKRLFQFHLGKGAGTKDQLSLFMKTFKANRCMILFPSDSVWNMNRVFYESMEITPYHAMIRGEDELIYINKRPPPQQYRIDVYDSSLNNCIKKSQTMVWLQRQGYHSFQTPEVDKFFPLLMKKPVDVLFIMINTNGSSWNESRWPYHVFNDIPIVCLLCTT